MNHVDDHCLVRFLEKLHRQCILQSWDSLTLNILNYYHYRESKWKVRFDIILVLKVDGLKKDLCWYRYPTLPMATPVTFKLLQFLMYKYLGNNCILDYLRNFNIKWERFDTCRQIYYVSVWNQKWYEKESFKPKEIHFEWRAMFTPYRTTLEQYWSP